MFIFIILIGKEVCEHFRDVKNFHCLLISCRIVAIGAEPHVNTCFKHFYYFVTEFELIPTKEMEPLVELVKQICKD